MASGTTRQGGGQTGVRHAASAFRVRVIMLVGLRVGLPGPQKGRSCHGGGGGGGVSRAEGCRVLERYVYGAQTRPVKGLMSAVLPLCCAGGLLVGRTQVKKRSAHTRPGVPMQQCSAVILHTHRYHCLTTGVLVSPCFVDQHHWSACTPQGQLPLTYRKLGPYWPVGGEGGASGQAASHVGALEERSIALPRKAGHPEESSRTPLPGV